MGLDARDEVGGHGAPEALAAHEHLHACARVRQVEDRLPGGVARADHDHVVAAALRRLAAPGAVVDAAPEQALDAVDVELAPLHPGRRQRDLGRDRAAVAQLEGDAPGAVAPVPSTACRRRSSAPALRLAPGKPGQLGAADSLGKAEEVLDHRGVGGLPAGHLALEDHGREAVACRVDRRREACGPAPTIARS